VFWRRSRQRERKSNRPDDGRQVWLRTPSALDALTYPSFGKITVETGEPGKVYPDEVDPEWVDPDTLASDIDARDLRPSPRKRPSGSGDASDSQ